MSVLAERFTTTTKDESPCIYAIINNENFSVYVGESKTPIRRMEQHARGLSSGTHPNQELQNDYNKGNNFTFCRIKSYTENDLETMRYYELKCMETLRKEGFKLYNCETDRQIKNLLRFNSHDWEIHCLMERKRNEYYKKYFGCTYEQFRSYYIMDKKKGRNNFLKYKIEWFDRIRKEEIEKEERDKRKMEKEKRKEFLKEHKRISFYIKKDTFEKLKNISENPDEYINMIIEQYIERKC